MFCTRKVNDDYTWVGADGRRLAMFEGVYDVPRGVSFNSYLLTDGKTVLFDTADASVCRVFLENVAHGLNGRALDYLVVQHMEPDHAADIRDLLVRLRRRQEYAGPVLRPRVRGAHQRGEGGGHPLHRAAHPALCGRAYGPLAGGADDL